MTRVIVHGASSFLGKHFLRTLAANQIPATILARTTSNIEEFRRNPQFQICRYNTHLDELGFDAMISADTTGPTERGPAMVDFAWHGVFGTERNQPEQLTVNIPMVLQSIQTAHRLRCSHWIGFGSQAEYGNHNRRISESDPCTPTTLYGKSKLICSHMSGDLCAALGMQHSWLRLFSVYGPDDNHQWLIPYLITEMLANRPINVTKGEQLWDYLYVDDISSMLMKLISAKGVGVANLGSGTTMAVRTIIETIRDLAGSESVINFGAIPYRDDQVMHMEADIARLSGHLNWQPQISLDAGLAGTVDFLRKRLLETIQS